MVCTEKVKVLAPDGRELELVPVKVWQLGKIKMGLFKDENGVSFKRKVPPEYPLC